MQRKLHTLTPSSVMLAQQEMMTVRSFGRPRKCMSPSSLMLGQRVMLNRSKPVKHN
jgi:hypothetical protein